MSIHGTSCEVIVITKPLLNSCHLQPDPVISHCSCFQIFIDSWKDKKPAEGGLREERVCSQSEGSISSHDGVKEQALSSQQALYVAPLRSSRLSVPFAWQAKQRPRQQLWDAHLIGGMGLEAWFLLVFCSKTKNTVYWQSNPRYHVPIPQAESKPYVGWRLVLKQMNRKSGKWILEPKSCSKNLESELSTACKI